MRRNSVGRIVELDSFIVELDSLDVWEANIFAFQAKRVLANPYVRAYVSARSEEDTMTTDSHEQRIRVKGDWTILIEPDFEFIDNGDSWQAHKGERVVYVSSIRVTDQGHKVPAEALLASTANGLGSGERISFSESDVRGEAEIKPSGTGSQLMGFMCADGAVATCVIDFEEKQDAHWATSTWKSLRFEPAGDTDKEQKPWWRFW